MIADALTVNAGSTSVKVTRFTATDRDGRAEDFDTALHESAPRVVIHRVVHGGDRTAPAVLDDDVVAELRALTELAPLHQPPALDAIARCRAAWPQAKQVACFDTTFHTSIPPAARTYALPERLRSRVRVYGFHGLAHAWAAKRVADEVPDARRIVVAHLGGGASLCAVRDGKSIATTMGFTPLDGLVMATRSGAVDPGALLWIAQNTSEALDTVLERESGLLGLCGTGDMREVEERAAAGDTAAQLALDVWLHRFIREAGGMIAVLGGLDVLAFSGGIGEHSADIRNRVTNALTCVGNVRTVVVHAREDLQMLDEASKLVTDI